MLSLILTLLLVWFILSVVLAAWTLFLQGYIYSEPVEQVFWRAPAAGTVLALFLAFWTLLGIKNPGRYDTLFQFSDTQTLPAFPELTAVIEGKEQVFKLGRGSDGRREYRRGNRVMPSRPESIIAVENGQKVTFQPDRDAAGKFTVEPGLGLRYRDDKGRWMEEGSSWQIEIFRPGWSIGNLALNFFHLAIWFLCLWLLLQFQWSHALGQAFACWLVSMLFLVPLLLDRATSVATLMRTAG